MGFDDEDLRQVLAGLAMRLDRIEELLTTVNRRSSVVLDDMWRLRDEWHRRGFTGQDRRRRSVGERRGAG